MSQSLTDSKFLDMVTLAIANKTPLLCYMKDTSIYSSMENVEDTVRALTHMVTATLKQGLKPYIWEMEKTKRVIEVADVARLLLCEVADEVTQIILFTDGDLRRSSTPTTD